MPYLPLCFYYETTGITGSRKENPEGRLMWLFALLSIRNQMTDMYRYCLRVDRIDTGQIWTPCIICYLWCPSFVAYIECSSNGYYILKKLIHLCKRQIIFCKSWIIALENESFRSLETISNVYIVIWYTNGILLVYFNYD